MIILDATTKSLEMKLGGAVATNELQCVLSYVEIDGSDNNAFTPTNQNSTSTGTTAVTILDAPAADNVFVQLKALSIINIDTAAVQVIIQINDTADIVRKIYAVNLQVGDSLQYIDTKGFTVFDADGNEKQIVVGPTVGSQKSTLNGTTNVTAVSAPSAGYTRKVLCIRVTNIDTAVVTVNLYKNISSTVTLVDTLVGLAVNGVWKPISLEYPMVLKDTTESLELDMGGAAATNNPIAYAEYEDQAS